MLHSVRVLDLSRLLPGPACTAYLQAMGAQVDRVESPKGDLTRWMPPLVDGVGAYYAATSQGKRSIIIDLWHAEAKSLILQMLPHYDVLVEGFRPGTMEKMGLHSSELLELFPNLIIARLSGFGQTGPWAKRVGHDINYISLAGVLSGQHIGEDGHSLPAVQVADMAGALTAAMGICGALFAVKCGEKGRVLDISLTESAMAMYGPMTAGYTASKTPLKPGGEWLTGGSSLYGTYCCSDGRWVSVGAIEPKFQQQVKQRAGSLTREALRKMFASNTCDYWCQQLSGACVAPVLDVQELAKHPQHEYRGAIQDGMVRLPFATSGQPIPKLGQHTRQVLTEVGLCGDDYQRLEALGVIGGDSVSTSVGAKV